MAITKPVITPTMILPIDVCENCVHIKQLVSKQNIYTIQLLTMADLIDTVVDGQRRIETMLATTNKNMADLKSRLDTLNGN